MPVLHKHIACKSETSSESVSNDLFSGVAGELSAELDGSQRCETHCSKRAEWMGSGEVEPLSLHSLRSLCSLIRLLVVHSDATDDLLSLTALPFASEVASDHAPLVVACRQKWARAESNHEDFASLVLWVPSALSSQKSCSLSLADFSGLGRSRTTDLFLVREAS